MTNLRLLQCGLLLVALCACHDGASHDREGASARDGSAGDADAARGDARVAAIEQPSGWDDDLRLAEAEDLDPDPNVVEIRLRASETELALLPGTLTKLYTYNGMLPGPLIRAKVGDRLRVHFENALPEPTTVHWHGVRLPANMDGVPVHSQPEVMPGETFEYEFVLRDAGLFWYHPHVASAKQVGFGLYGALLVEDPNEPKALGDELVLVLSDIGLDEQGVIAPPDQGGDLATLFGREGTHILVNGRIRPTLHARAGMRQRWRVLDAAKSRYFQVAIEGHDFLRIGGDGGLLEYPITEERFLVSVAERADLLFVPHGAPGSTLTARWVPYDRGFGSTEFRPEEPILDIVLEPGPAAPTPVLPGIARTIEPLRAEGAIPVALRLTQQTGGGMLVLGINDVPAWMAAPLPAQVGDTQLWTIDNRLDWAHPFHLHGFFFQVLGDDGQPQRPLAWRDTVNVGVHETVRLLVRFDERPGMWMFHCHILDHADAGMMGMVELVQRDDTAK